MQSVEDVAELLSGFDGLPKFPQRGVTATVEDCRLASSKSAEDGDAAVASLLTSAPVAVDELIRQSGASAPSVHMALLELEIGGKLLRHAGGRVSLA